MNAFEILALLRLLAKFIDTDNAKALASDCVSDTYEAVEILAKSMGFSSEELFHMVDSSSEGEGFVICEEGFEVEHVNEYLAGLAKA